MKVTREEHRGCGLPDLRRHDQNMTDHTRYAIYWTSRPGPLTDCAAAWLGWNPWTSVETPPTPGFGRLPGSSKITEEPRRYGFHATLKAPFRLAEGRDRGGLEAAVQRFAEDQAAVRLDGSVSYTHLTLPTKRIV